MVNLNKKQREREKKKLVRILSDMGFQSSERRNVFQYDMVIHERPWAGDLIKAAIRAEPTLNDKEIDSYYIQVWSTKDRNDIYPPISGTVSFSSQFRRAKDVIETLMTQIWNLAFGMAQTETTKFFDNKIKHVLKELNNI